MIEAPAGFARVEANGVELWVAEDLKPGVDALGLLAPGAVDALFTSAGSRADAGATGRGPTALVALPAMTERLLLRRLIHGGLFGPLLGERFWSLRRPQTELIVTDTLRRAGAPVPRPALVVGEVLGLGVRAAIATVYEEGAVDALAFLEGKPPPARILRAAVALGKAVREFHDAGGRHGDLHVKNLLVRERGDHTEALVIDLDKARVTPGLTPGERMAQIMRLFRSLVKREVLETLGPRGCARFFSSYCGDDRLLRRALWQRVDRELRKVAIHALRYR